MFRVGEDLGFRVWEDLGFRGLGLSVWGLGSLGFRGLGV